MNTAETYDVVVVGSGSAGAVSALRAAELGLSVLIVEKAHKYGGTSAVSGGVLWVPNHKLTNNDDNREQTLKYLNSIIKSSIQRDRLDAFLDEAPQMVKFLKGLGVPLTQSVWPDYYPSAPGARAD